MAIEAPLSERTARLTNTLLLVRPDSFGFNDQTASTNSFQNHLSPDSGGSIRDQALREFAEAVDTLQKSGVEVVVCPSRSDVETPDAVFPNNWISVHDELDGIHVILYPMLAPNRRAERQFDKVRQLIPWINTDPSHVLDLTHHEATRQFLEGTGSLVFDRKNKVVFAHESARTSYLVLDDFCSQTGYSPVKFHACDKNGKPIYHTNVVLSIGEGFSIACLEAIEDTHERATVEDMFRELRLQVIPISLDQLHSFCGNILEVRSAGRPKIIMSTTAFGAFTQEQKEQLSGFGDLIPVKIPTIEQVGGGSARCMLAEIFPGSMSY